ncbi:MAG: hypothetical protein ACP5MB_11455, partial [bacterium]
DGTSCLNIPTPPSSSCSCNGNAYTNDGKTIYCISTNQTLPTNSCTSYYITGTFTDNGKGLTLKNKNLYVSGGVNITGPLNLTNSTFVTDGIQYFDSTVNATNSNIYTTGGAMIFEPGTVLSGTKVYNGVGGITFNSTNGQNITADLCGNSHCNSNNDSIVFTNGILNIYGPIQGGLLYGNGGLSISGVNGNGDVGTTTEPVVAISGMGTNASMNISMSETNPMSGTTQFNGLIMSWLLGNFTIENNQINGALYANNLVSFSVGDNASINFNYAILSQIANAFPTLFDSVNCYNNGPQQVMLNAMTLY